MGHPSGFLISYVGIWAEILLGYLTYLFGSRLSIEVQFMAYWFT